MRKNGGAYYVDTRHKHTATAPEKRDKRDKRDKRPQPKGRVPPPRVTRGPTFNFTESKPFLVIKKTEPDEP